MLSIKSVSFVYRKFLESNGFPRVFWQDVRRHLVKWLGDPPCEMGVHGYMLQMPLSHALPDYFKRFPLYDRLPGRLAQFLRDRHGYLNCIDIGANIGDTIAALKPNSLDRFLAIEPNPRYLRYLRNNWGLNDAVTIKDYFCSAVSEFGRYELREKVGTASFEKTEGKGTTLTTYRLDDIVEKDVEISNFNLLKIDTDGYDFEILRGAQNSIRKIRPTVFYECDYFSNANYVEDCLEIFNLFKEAEYTKFMLYSNFGQLIGCYGVDEISFIKQLLLYQMSIPYFYYDILMMPGDDLECFYRSEREFFIDRLPSAMRRTASNFH